MRIVRTATLALAALCLSTAARADEIRVLSAGAFKPVAAALAADFERRTGHTVRIENDTAGALVRRIGGGEAFDLVIVPGSAMQQLSATGRVAAGAARPLAKVGIGVAVAPGRPLPDIGSVDAFKAALLAARSVAWIDPAAGGSSGIYLAGLFERLGIAAQVRAKSVLVPGGLVAQRVVRGEADLAIHQISEILAVPGAVLVGPLPAEIQNHTIYVGAPAAAARDPAGAQAFLDELGSAAARALLADKGMEAP
jgi:molybdate transport system substrate-binding protein